VHYSPPRGYRLDVEVVDATDLRRRVTEVPGRGIERVDFHVVLVVTGGRYRHMIDFDVYDCTAGSCLVVQPGQVHRFGDEPDWTGWLLIFRSDLLGPRSASDAAGNPEGLLTSVAMPAHVDLPTNFGKFFRRETGVTPGGFRSERSLL